MISGKKHIGQLVSIKYVDRDEPIYGFVLDYNDDWTLMKHNPVDYIVDGFIILRHKNIRGFRRDIEEKFREKVITLKRGRSNKKEMVPLSDLKSILTYLTRTFGVFQLETKSETACYLGKLKSIDSQQLIIDFLDATGKWNGSIKFRPGDIRVIAFDTDYINSLKLLLKNKN